MHQFTLLETCEFLITVKTVNLLSIDCASHKPKKGKMLQKIGYSIGRNETQHQSKRVKGILSFKTNNKHGSSCYSSKGFWCTQFSRNVNACSKKLMHAT